MLRMLLVGACALCAFGFSAASASAYVPKDPDIQGKPKDLADLYLVDNEGQEWCGPTHQHNSACPSRTSQNAFLQLVADIWRNNYQSDVQFMRVGKVSGDTCHSTEAPWPAGPCRTAVPPIPPDPSCSGHFSANTWCQLAVLKNYRIKLGVIITAEGRNARDVVWHACQIHAADRAAYPNGQPFLGGPGFYDFMFLDFAGALGADLPQAVGHIARGERWDGTPCPGGGSGWDLITNDNGYDVGAGHSLATNAWAHAAHLGALTKAQFPTRIQQAGNPRADGTYAKPPLTPEDRKFIADVQSANQGDGTTAILRPEVAAGTSRLADTPVETQIRFYQRAAAVQDAEGYTLLYPFYVHGNGGNQPGPRDDNSPYDAWTEQTAVWWEGLMRAYR